MYQAPVKTPNRKLEELFGTGKWTDRLKRFVPPGSLPQGVGAMVDDEKNILMIDKEIYDGVPERIKNKLWRVTEGKVDYHGREIAF